MVLLMLGKILIAIRFLDRCESLRQESWIQQMSFRDNIIFGKTYNEHWYEKVIEACALENDIQVKYNKICEDNRRFFC